MSNNRNQAIAIVLAAIFLCVLLAAGFVLFYAFLVFVNGGR
jgi:hypothetical protein